MFTPMIRKAASNIAVTLALLLFSASYLALKLGISLLKQP